MGFCLLGNAAIATRYAQQQFGVDRVLIVDYDVHHGNGTEAMFYTDPSVRYVSTHQYPFYPMTGAAADVGSGAGEGYTINIPLPAGSGDTNYMQCFPADHLAGRRTFSASAILVSLGLDAYWDDPLAGMRLTLRGYSDLAGEVVQMADQLCDGRVVFLLEGGYDLDALRYGLANVARLLLGDPPTDPLGAPSDRRADPDITALVEQIRKLHRL